MIGAAFNKHLDLNRKRKKYRIFIFKIVIKNILKKYWKAFCFFYRKILKSRKIYSYDDDASCHNSPNFERAIHRRRRISRGHEESLRTRSQTSR
jgi:hypothetical protein